MNQTMKAFQVIYKTKAGRLKSRMILDVSYEEARKQVKFEMKDNAEFGFIVDPANSDAKTALEIK